jgi:hypothetical protein
MRRRGYLKRQPSSKNRSKTPFVWPDKGWDYEKADGQDAALKRVVMDRLSFFKAPTSGVRWPS